jgi:hypothetical protein
LIYGVIKMEKIKVYGLVLILVCILMFAPVAAWQPTISKTCTVPKCLGEPVTCTITVHFLSENFKYIGRVVDTLPTGATDVSSSGDLGSGSYDATLGTVTWDPIKVPTAGLTKTLTVTFTPHSSPFQNHALAEVRRCLEPNNWVYQRTTDSDKITVEECSNVPEFPSPALPVALIGGFIGAVFLIQRTRE